jgi:hypothetical protein
MKKRLIPSIVLYVFAALIAIYTIWSVSLCADTISQYVASGQLIIKGAEYEVLTFYLTSCGPYAGYALLLAWGGLVLQRMRPASDKAAAIAAPPEEKAKNIDYDEWYNEAEVAEVIEVTEVAEVAEITEVEDSVESTEE